MATKATVPLMILVWEDELRSAAMALGAFANLPKGTPVAEATKAANTALNACWAALSALANNPDAPLLMGSKGLVQISVETTVEYPKKEGE